MGQKTHPYGFRLVYNKGWKSRWYADKDYAKILESDIELRTKLKKRLAHTGVSQIDIDRAADRLRDLIRVSEDSVLKDGLAAEVSLFGTHIAGVSQEQVGTNRAAVIKRGRAIAAEKE